ncbi:pectinesterase inhibitor-like [Humulus lupulus]|uniref:pectinesterase inhibitor-like n=1 Tax=Humulus lupulus TaxID=3486 RepID=UPI002B40FF64|nr:pectinesterase inhibitor-like [Humulus lupulus]
MAYSKTLVLVFLTLSQFFHQHPHLAKADSKLILNVCRATDVPDICIQCLQSDPYAEFASAVELAFIMMNCISSHADALQVNMEDTASNSKNKSTKSVYNACVKAYMAAKKDLKSAIDHLQSYEIDEAESYVGQAMLKHQSCYYAIENNKELTIPSEVAYEMKIYEELCFSTERIIERF